MLNAIKLARLRAGYTQLEVAKRAKVSPISVCYWETGKSKPRAGSLKRLADALGVRVEDLIEDGQKGA